MAKRLHVYEYFTTLRLQFCHTEIKKVLENLECVMTVCPPVDMVFMPVWLMSLLCLSETLVSPLILPKHLDTCYFHSCSQSVCPFFGGLVSVTVFFSTLRDSSLHLQVPVLLAMQGIDPLEHFGTICLRGQLGFCERICGSSPLMFYHLGP